MKIKKGDNIVVIAGKNKGTTGQVMRTFKKTERIVVKGVNLRKKHIKKTASRPGEIITFEAPIHVSNVMMIDPKTKKRSRVGYQKLKDGKKIRIAKTSKETLENNTPSKQ
jgi:large subunit ribosomal protein L24